MMNHMHSVRLVSDGAGIEMLCALLLCAWHVHSVHMVYICACPIDIHWSVHMCMACRQHVHSLHLYYIPHCLQSL